MTDRELIEEFAKLRTIATNIIGFDFLCEKEDLPTLSRLKFEAIVYAEGVNLATMIVKIMGKLDDA